ACAGFFQSDSEIRRDRRFADATFAARNRNDMLDALDACRPHSGRSSSRRRRVDVDQNTGVLDAGQGAEDLLGLGLDSLWNRGLVRGERELHRDASAIDLDSFYQ